MYIPINLRMHRIMGRNRKEPCKCGHFHTSKEVFIPELTYEQYVDVVLWLLKMEKQLNGRRYKWYSNQKELVKHTPKGDIVFKRVKYDRTE